MKQKILSIILTAVLVFGLTACDWSAYIDSSGQPVKIPVSENPKPQAQDSSEEEQPGEAASPEAGTKASEAPQAPETVPQENPQEQEEPSSEDLEDATGEKIPQDMAEHTFVHKEFTSASEDYFSDALFIGDSRTVGLYRYGGIEGATWYCDTGLSVYNSKDKVLNVEGKGDITLEDLLLEDSYGKIYVGLGINELGYDMNETAERYSDLIERIKQLQSRAVIIVMANIHVAPERSNKDNIYNNKNINKINEKLKALADGVRVYYIDPNPLFDDENGNLKQSYTHDSTHFLGKYYPMWTEFIKEHAIE